MGKLVAFEGIESCGVSLTSSGVEFLDFRAENFSSLDSPNKSTLKPANSW